MKKTTLRTPSARKKKSSMTPSNAGGTKKTKKEIVIDESQLEKFVEENEIPENINNEDELQTDLNLNELSSLNLKNFLEVESSSSVPALERVAGNEARPIFFRQGGTQTTSTTTDETENGGDFKYISGTAAANEPKYIADSHLYEEPTRINVAEVGRKREIFPEVNQELFFERASEARGFNLEPQGVERVERAERFDVEKAGRESFAKREEAKYEKYKPKLPKS